MKLIDKNESQLVIYNKYFYFLILHFKLSSLFFSSQLVDIFSYETTTNTHNKEILVYNFHNIFFNKRFFLFILFEKKNFIYINSITELYQNAN